MGFTVLIALLLCTAALPAAGGATPQRGPATAAGGQAAAAAGGSAAAGFPLSSYECTKEPSKKARVCFLRDFFIYQGHLWYVSGD